MLDTIIGLKQKMGAVYIKDRRYPVTWVKVEPCVVTQIKSLEKDGYISVQLGMGNKKEKRFTKPLLGHLKKTSNNKTPRYLREIRIKEVPDLKPGDEIKVSDVLKKGDFVMVTGTSKGKGFAGVVKRWGFAGGPKTHGQSDRERSPGSIGQRTTPGRIYKGKKMAGRMGSDRVTVKNLTIIDIDEGKNLVGIVGPVPGVENGLVFIKKTGEGGVKVESIVVEEKVVEQTTDIKKDSDAKTETAKDETNVSESEPEVLNKDEKKEGSEKVNPDKNEANK